MSETLLSQSFIGITHRFTLSGLVIIVMISSMGQIDLLENYLY